ncbi:MAG: hypothetical protein JWO32_708 [Bacteroidetes bacterium]|nr:hypothetical protein [Bacteroidota bacterium]
MKKWILMTIGMELLRQVAKHYKINTFEDVIKLITPYIKDLLPQPKKDLAYN